MNKKEKEFKKTIYEYISLNNQIKSSASENLKLIIEEQKYKLFLIWDGPILTNIESNLNNETKKIPQLKTITYIKNDNNSIKPLPDPSFLREMAIANLKIERNREMENIDRADKAQGGRLQQSLRVKIQSLEESLTSHEMRNDFNIKSLEMIRAESYKLSKTAITKRKKKIKKQMAKLKSERDDHEQIIKSLAKLQKDLEAKAPITEIISKIKKLANDKDYQLIDIDMSHEDTSVVSLFINRNYSQQVTILQDLKYKLEDLEKRMAAINADGNESNLHHKKKLEIRLKNLEEEIEGHQARLQDISTELHKNKSKLNNLMEDLEKNPDIIKGRKSFELSRKKVREKYREKILLKRSASDEELLAPYKNRIDNKRKLFRKTVKVFEEKQFKKNEWIIRDLRESKKQWDKIIDQRRSIISEKKITRLLHFTTVENMMSIIKNQSIYSVDFMKKEKISHSISDSNRLDGKIDYISLSISFPNYKMLHQKRRGSSDDWVILEINPEILCRQLCLFYKNNAASSKMRNKLFPSSNVDFRNMFADLNNHRLENELMLNETTDPQAEILVKRKINISYISKALFENKKIEMKYHDQLKDKIKSVTDPSLFTRRKDWQSWVKYY